jgi:hypothetical protein
MSPKKTSSDKDRMYKILAEARREQERREKGYREQALRLFPPVCARCGREFEGKRLRELTVHHRDHDHDNNPPDGSNWELLCLYCHDNEHSRQLTSQWCGEATPGGEQKPRATYRPFANLKDLWKDEE